MVGDVVVAMILLVVTALPAPQSTDRSKRGTGFLALLHGFRTHVRYSCGVSEEHFRELAAVTEAKEVATIRAAAGALAEAFGAWRASPAWKMDRELASATRFEAAVRTMVTRLAALPDSPLLHDVKSIVSPPLGLWVGRPDVRAAQEKLRAAALHQPGVTAFARSLLGVRDRRDPPPGPETSATSSRTPRP
jgi:hypothetical protein